MKQVEKWLLLDGLLAAGIAFLWYQKHLTLGRVLDFLSSWSAWINFGLFVMFLWLALIGICSATGFVARKLFPNSILLARVPFGGLLVLSLMLVVIYGMTFTCMCGSRTKARDAKRMSDMRQFVTAQDMHYENAGKYFQAASMPESIANGEIVYLTVPEDPGAAGTIYNWIDNTSDSTQFCVYAKLENAKLYTDGCGGGCLYYLASQDGNFYRKEKPKVLADCVSAEARANKPPIDTVKNSPTPILDDDLSSYYYVKAGEGAVKNIKDINLTADNYPLIDGATASQPIRSLIVCEAFNAGCDKWYESQAREMFLYPNLYRSSGLTSEEINKLGPKINKNSKTHDAYLNLINSKNDLILVSTKPSEDELKEAKRLGVKLEVTPIGLDGFVFLVNSKNTVNNLSTANIIDIYSGKITNWKSCGGDSSEIRAFTRQRNSGSQELMEKLVMKQIPIDATLGVEEWVFMGMSELIEGVEKYGNSIGYSLYYYKNSMIDKRAQQPDVKLISVDGVVPNPENIASGKYPYTFNIYAVVRASQPKDSPNYQIKEWLTSSEGQAVIQKAGYVGLGDTQSLNNASQYQSQSQNLQSK